MRVGLSLLGKLLGKERSPFMALDVGYMDANTMYGMSVGWEKGYVAGSQYSPWLFTHAHTIHR